MSFLSSLTSAALKRPVGLALSGGAAGGIAHIGVLRALEEHKIPIDRICGTSAGALVGGLYASGMSTDALIELTRTVRWPKLVHLTGSRKGLVKNNGIRDLIRKVIGEVRFQDMQIPLQVTATNLDTGELHVFDSGPVAVAIQASCCIPVLFEPVQINGHQYVDGGILKNLPISPLREAGCRSIIAVNLANPTRGKELPSYSLFSIAVKSFFLMLSQAADRDGENPDIEIAPDLSGLNIFRLKDGAEFMQRGYREAVSILQSKK